MQYICWLLRSTEDIRTNTDILSNSMKDSSSLDDDIFIRMNGNSLSFSHGKFAITVKTALLKIRNGLKPCEMFLQID